MNRVSLPNMFSAAETRALTLCAEWLEVAFIDYVREATLASLESDLGDIVDIAEDEVTDWEERAAALGWEKGGSAGVRDPQELRRFCLQGADANKRAGAQHLHQKLAPIMVALGWNGTSLPNYEPTSGKGKRQSTDQPRAGQGGAQ